jgi:hypothetical protein
MTIALASSVHAQALRRDSIARADSIWKFDARVVQVISGGTWTDGDRTGQFRIVVRSDGTDQVHYTTVVQWMLRRGLRQDLELVRSVDLSTVTPRWYSILGPELRYSRGRWILAVHAADAPLREAKHRPQYLLGAPGIITPR